MAGVRNQNYFHLLRSPFEFGKKGTGKKKAQRPVYYFIQDSQTNAIRRIDVRNATSDYITNYQGVTIGDVEGFCLDNKDKRFFYVVLYINAQSKLYKINAITLEFVWESDVHFPEKTNFVTETNHYIMVGFQLTNYFYVFDKFTGKRVTFFHTENVISCFSYNNVAYFNSANTQTLYMIDDFLNLTTKHIYFEFYIDPFTGEYWSYDNSNFQISKINFDFSIIKTYGKCNRNQWGNLPVIMFTERFIYSWDYNNGSPLNIVIDRATDTYSTNSKINFPFYEQQEPISGILMKGARQLDENFNVIQTFYNTVQDNSLLIAPY